jgi:hypothetical protein
MQSVAEPDLSCLLIERINAIGRPFIQRIGNLLPQHPIAGELFHIAEHKILALAAKCFAVLITERLLHSQLQSVVEHRRPREEDGETRCAA